MDESVSTFNYNIRGFVACFLRKYNEEKYSIHIITLIFDESELIHSIC